MALNGKADVVIVGAGIVGLATAYRLLSLRPKLSVVVLEKEAAVATHQTGHNSGVIHSGIYYKPGSLKAQNCVRGYRLLLDFLREAELPHEICGKLVVATEESELPRLRTLEERGRENGLDGIRRLTELDEIRAVEPHVNGIEALFVPQTGIVDFRVVARALLQKLQERGASVRFNENVRGIHEASDGVELATDGRPVQARFLVGCAGLHSDRLARAVEPDLPLRIVPFRGEYYRLKPEAKHLVRNLIYPVPNPDFPFLGVHFTRTAWGDIDAGPNAVLALKREGYGRTDLDPEDLFETLSWPGFYKLVRKHWREGTAELIRSWYKPHFVAALQRLIPEVKSEDLEPAGAGVRAQACGRDGKLLDDFELRSTPRQLHVCNAPSPAATSSLSIGQSIAESVIAALA
jgi:L-2-hydroxyglutarate oxidase